MKRLLMNQLVRWKTTPDRKPLVLHGARQVGKTYLLQEFGKKHFPATHYLNFEKNRQIHSIFNGNLDPKRIVSELELLLDIKIDGNDLLIFDEIQECPNALTSLKYFHEEAPSYFICCAGSLLGVRYNEHASYPVGKTTALHLYPMNFEEFLTAQGEERICSYINDNSRAGIHQISLSEAIHLRIWELLKVYMVTGGMPEVIKTYLENSEKSSPAALQQLRDVQTGIFSDYLLDMAKHSGNMKAMNIERVLKSVPSQLAREQGRYRFTDVIPGRRGFSSLADPIDWLCGAGLIHKTMIANEAALPFSAYTKENTFKLYMFDVGLLGALSEIPPRVILSYDYGRFKGYFAENFVASEVIATGETSQLHSWRHGTSEIEFIREYNGTIYPVEVKAGINTKAQSLRTYMSRYNPPFGVIMSAMNTSSRGKIFNVPLYFAANLATILSQETR